MAFTDATQQVARRALEEAFDHHIETALRSVLPFSRREPGPLQLVVAGTSVPIYRISAAVRREIAVLIDGQAMAGDIELMMRGMGIRL